MGKDKPGPAVSIEFYYQYNRNGPPFYSSSFSETVKVSLILYRIAETERGVV